MLTHHLDIISLFGAPCPLTPVYTGEIQVLGLGMAIRAWDYLGADVTSAGAPPVKPNTKALTLRLSPVYGITAISFASTPRLEDCICLGAVTAFSSLLV
jgi:hypothetical protein